MASGLSTQRVCDAIVRLSLSQVVPALHHLENGSGEKHVPKSERSTERKSETASEDIVCGYDKSYLTRILHSVLNELVTSNQDVARCVDPNTHVDGRNGKLEDIVVTLSTTLLEQLFLEQKTSMKAHKAKIRLETEKQQTLLIENCALNILSLFNKGFDHFYRQLLKYSRSDKEIGELRSEMLAFLNGSARSSHVIASATNQLLGYIITRSLVICLDKLKSIEESAQTDEYFSSYIASILDHSKTLERELVELIEVEFGLRALRKEECNQLWAYITVPTLKSVVDYLIQYSQINLSNNGKQRWKTFCNSDKPLNEFAFLEDDFQKTDQRYVPENASSGGVDLGNGQERICVPIAEWKQIWTGPVTQGETRTVEPDSAEDFNSTEEQTYETDDFEKFERRITFAPGSDLRTIREVPKYSEDERKALFYTNTDINNFLVDATAEEEALFAQEQLELGDCTC